MKSKRKFSIYILMVSIISVFLSGCGSSGTTYDTSISPVSDENVTSEYVPRTSWPERPGELPDPTVVYEIYSRIPPFIPLIHDYRGKPYVPDGEFAHTADYGDIGADPSSSNPVTKVNGGLKAWSLWHRGGRSDPSLLETARMVGLDLRDIQTVEGIIPAPAYTTPYYFHEEGWHSGIQLKTLALWSRLWSVEADTNEKLIWHDAIDRMVFAYLRPISQGGVLATLEDVEPTLGDLWLPEEYPHLIGNQRHILNGAQFATLAIRDAGEILDDPILIQWSRKFEEALIVVARYATWQVDDIVVTSYGLEYLTGFDTEPKLLNAGYHITNCILGAIMYSAFGREEWSDLTDQWIETIY